MVVIESPKMRINLVDKVDKVDDEIKRGEQYISFLLLLSLL